MSYKESDLVLQVSKNVNPQVWDEGKYSTFFDIVYLKIDNINLKQPKLFCVI